MPTAHAAQTFMVTNGSDNGPGSLRQAIIDANNNPGMDTINFNLSGTSLTITPVLGLPMITDPVVIDGTTQPGFAGTPIIELAGKDSPSVGLSVNAPGSTIRGLIINTFDLGGIFIATTGGGTHVEGCYIGTDASGVTAAQNGGPGVSVLSSNNVIGGTTPAAHNVISGNLGAGVQIELFCCTGTIPIASGNLVQGNYIGVNAAGNAAIPNEREGVVITTAAPDADVNSNTVGGTAPGAGNVISGNHGEGISLGSFQTTANVIQGNLIGTDATGSFSVPNDGEGIGISFSRNNIIGGSVPGARNVVSGNGRNGSGTGHGDGIGIGGTGNIVRGNFVGTNAAGTGAIPNLLFGIAVGGSNNTIGGVNPGEGNVVAFNGFDGIVNSSTSGSGDTFRGNSIFSNGVNLSPGLTLGIDIGASGVTLNDAGDADTGANGLQNFPVITLVTVGPSSVNVKGSLNSTANTTFSLDFYANSVCDASGYGEGARRIGSAQATTNANGDVNFDLDFAVTMPLTQVLTATATDPNGNTSEFSQCAPNSSAVGSLSFASTNVIASESSGSALFEVNRTGGSAGSLTVNYAVMAVTATAGVDFTPTQGSLTFADGETSKNFSVPLLDDNVSEPFFETAKVSLTTSGNLDTLGPLSVIMLNIMDDEPIPTISIGDVSAAEGNSGTTEFNFGLTLSGPSSRAITINFMTSDGSASAGSDYLVPATASVVIPAGQTIGVIAIKVVGDTNSEPDETFFVDLTSSALIADRHGQGTILNDEGGTTPLPLLLLDESSAIDPRQAAALDTTLFLRDPFPVVNSKNKLVSGTDRNTRVMIFMSNLELAQGEPSSSAVVNLMDFNGQTFDVAAADVRSLPNTAFVQVVFRLPDSIAPGHCTVRVKAHNTISNSAGFTVAN